MVTPMSEIINLAALRNDSTHVTPLWLIDHLTDEDRAKIASFDRGIFILLDTGVDGAKWRTQFFNASMRKSEIVALLFTCITALSMELNGDRDA